MKNINLSLLVLFFSSLLIGCGMKGPLYKEAPPALTQEEIQKQQDEIVEVDTTEALTTSE